MTLRFFFANLFNLKLKAINPGLAGLKKLLLTLNKIKDNKINAGTSLRTRLFSAMSVI